MLRIITVILFSAISLLSEDRFNISGTIFSLANKTKQPIAGAKLLIKDANSGTFTNSQGEFNLANLKESQIVLISSVGFHSNSFTIKSNQLNYSIEMVSLVQTGKQIVVTGERASTQIDYSNAQKSEFITSKGLKKAACCNLSESFETNPSVDVSFSDALSGAKQIEMLGLAGKYSQILQERVNSNIGLMQPFGLGFIPGSWMNSIQIAKGTGSVTTGYESVSGQINVEYKKPQDLLPLFVNLYSNSLGRYEANIDYSLDVIPSKVQSTLFAHYSTGIRGNDMNKDGFTEVPTYNQFNLLNKWNFNFESFEGQAGLKVMTDTRHSGEMNFLDGNDRAKYWGLEIKNRMAEYYTKTGIVFDSEHYQSIGIITNYRYHDIHSYFGQKDYSAFENFFNLQVLYDNNYFGDDYKLKFGTDIKLIGYREYLQQNNITSDFGYDQTVSGLFGELTAKPMENLFLVLGTRADYSNIHKLFVTPRLNLKYNFDEFTFFRLAYGKGHFLANPLSENISMLSSARKVSFDKNQILERATNYGINFLHKFNLWNLDIDFQLEAFRTVFDNQLIVDMEKPSEINLLNMTGVSYANSYQIQTLITTNFGFIFNLAYRLNVVKYTIDNIIVQKPLMSQEKGFINIEYSDSDLGLATDITLSYNGGGRIAAHHNSNSSANSFAPFWICNGQITKTFSTLDVYLGVENLTNFVQSNPILSPETPFGNTFDATQIWGPIQGRTVYLGIRYLFN